MATDLSKGSKSGIRHSGIVKAVWAAVGATTTEGGVMGFLVVVVVIDFLVVGNLVVGLVVVVVVDFVVVSFIVFAGGSGGEILEVVTA